MEYLGAPERENENIKKFQGYWCFSVNELENKDALTVFVTARKIYQIELLCQWNFREGNIFLTF